MTRLKKSVAEELRKKLSKRKKAKAKKFKSEPDDLFSKGRSTGGVEQVAHDANVLRLEWAIKYSSMTPKQYLINVKGYSETQASKVLHASGSAHKWRAERESILDKMTETTVKRHVDLAAEVQDTHIKAAKIGLLKAMEYMANLRGEPYINKETGEPLRGDDRKILYKPYKSNDLVNAMGAVEKAQNVYRKAMGLSSDEGLTQILSRIQINNTQINNGPVPEGGAQTSKISQTFKEMDYDDVMEFVEIRREQKRLAEKAEEVIDVEEV